MNVVTGQGLPSTAEERSAWEAGFHAAEKQGKADEYVRRNPLPGFNLAANILMAGAGSEKVLAGAATKELALAKDFFEGTRYTDKVLGQMKQGDFHAFPESVKGFQDAGQLSKLTGGDGAVRDMLKIPGNYRGKDGFFEFIKEANGDINHRLFRPTPGQ